MKPTPVNMNTKKLGGGCPHGIPAGACPVCSGMGGGSGTKRKNEMSWDECYSFGLAMKSAKNSAELNKLAAQQSIAQTMEHNRLATMIAAKLSAAGNFLRAAIIVPVVNLINNVTQPIIRMANNVFTAISNQFARFTEGFKQILNNLPNIMDKLAAVFGEQEKALRENLEKNLNKIKKKLFSFFEAVDGSMEQGKGGGQGGGSEYQQEGKGEGEDE